MAETELEKRVSALEKKRSGGWRFFIQYLASPLAVVVLGAIVSYIVNREQRQLEQVQVAQTMLPALFSTDKFQALATKRLFDAIITDAELRGGLDQIVEDFFTSQIKTAVEQGDMGSVKSVYDAATAIGGVSGTVIANAVNRNQETKDKLAKYEQARPHELNALEAIADNRLDAALQEIRQAESIYPDLHSVREVRQVLESKRNDFASPAAQAEIKSEVAEKYNWKVPETILQRLRSK